MAFQEPPSYRKTNSNFGWTDESFDTLVEQFVAYCASVSRPVLDIGAGHGSATAAVIAGGGRVTALDLAQEHLDKIRSRIDVQDADRLTTVLAEFPTSVTLPRGAYGAALIARVMHFFDGPRLEASARLLFDLLAPGGRVYASAGTPFKGNMRAFQPIYEARIAAGDPYPGIVADTSLYFPPALNLPPMMNFLDVPVLRRVFAGAGFEIIDASYYARPSLPAEMLLDGRDGVALIAAKP